MACPTHKGLRFFGGRVDEVRGWESAFFMFFFRDILQQRKARNEMAVT